jgi:tetratricopeptide (TPR) repeat protein
MAHLMFELKLPEAKKHFNHIIKKHPTSDYAIASEYYICLIDVENLPKTGKKKDKETEKALNHFKTYLEKSPDGRFSLKSADEIIKLDEFYQDEGCSGALNKIFVARNCKKKYAQKLDEDEIVEYITLTFEEIKELLNNKYIMGGHTKLAIEKYKEFITK